MSFSYWRKRASPGSFAYWGKRAFSGFSPYRYGEKPKPQTCDRILVAGKRESVVNAVIDRLKDWRLSPFENEADLRAGLRIGFIQQGYSWHRSDMEAQDILHRCFTIMGLQRPSWEQGQREYTVPEENCAWCEREIDIENRTGLRAHRCCSPECAKALILHRDSRYARRHDPIFTSALRIARRAASKPRDCNWCRKEYQPMFDAHSQEYCSVRCYAEARRKRIVLQCAGCGSDFHKSPDRGLFCSKSCYRLSLATPTLKMQCVWCDADFMASQPARFCCSQHKQAATRAKRKQNIPERNCEECGQSFKPKEARTVCCSRPCIGKRISRTKLAKARSPAPANVLTLPPISTVPLTVAVLDHLLEAA